MNKLQTRCFLTLTILIITLNKALSIDFVFNGFNSIDPILLYGFAALDKNDRVLSLTNDTHFSIGRALYDTKIPARRQLAALPFSTSFIFAMAPYRRTLPGHGLVFLFTPVVAVAGDPSAQNLGFINRTNNGRPDNHVLGVEFDVFKNEEFDDPDDNHVGIDVNSLNSRASHGAGFWPDHHTQGSTDQSLFETLKLNNGENYQAWIDYNTSVLTVTMARAGMRRPKLPLLSYEVDLSEVFVDDMYVGFTSSTGQLVQSHKILAWSFSNEDFTLSERLVTAHLPSFVLPKKSVFEKKGFVASLITCVVALVILLGLLAICLTKKRRRLARERADMEDWEYEYWPHRMSYRDIEEATKGFAEQNVIGIGGNGKVYRGVMQGGAEIAVKQMSRENDGMREFLAEVSSLGRLKHRSLVGLRGWCKRERGVFMLVYDYMENGSLDRRVYQDCDEAGMLGFDDRVRILVDVAKGVLYLHEGWESKVLHRDIKASNVLLDKDMSGRLGDFGLARVQAGGGGSTTTRVVGTVGYMAPEVVRKGRATPEADVFGFGALVLEVMCGRRPVEEGKPALAELVWRMMNEGRISEAVDGRLRARGEFKSEAAERVLQLGLLCVCPEPGARPSMRQVVKVLEGNVGGGDVECEEIDVYLLEKMRNNGGGGWSGFDKNFGYGCSPTHPTFEDVKQSVSSTSMSASWSSTIVEGR